MTNRTILVSGASGGVGRGIATCCGQVGWTVWIAARREAEGRTVAKEVNEAGGTGRFVGCDVTDPESIANVVAEVRRESGRLDGLVHNATSGWSSKARGISDVTLDEVEDQIAVNLRGFYSLILGSFDMLAAAGGSVVLMTSEASFEGKPLIPVYSMVKASQRGLARVLAREWGPAGVRINCIAPLSSSPAMDIFFENPANKQRVLGRLPLDRLGDPTTDIGPAVRFLLSDDARFLTGQTIMADGGSCPIT